MRIVVLASRKGGAGKTTLAAHLAVAAEDAGAGPVALIDLDPMQGLTQWWDAREGEQPVLIKAELAAVIPQLKEAGIHLLIVDTPPSIGLEVAQALQHADLGVIPVRPSPNDLRAVASTVQLINLARKPLAFIINAVKPRVRLTTQAYEALSPHGVIGPLMHDRTDYAAAMTDGRTAPELDRKGPAAAEIAKLWEFIQARLDLTP
jgi:chromosome partitioning protein